MNEKKKKYLFGGFLASLAMVFGLIGMSSAEAFGVRGETTVKCCVGLDFGTEGGAGTDIVNDESDFYTIVQSPDESFAISSLTSSKAYRGSSSGHALRLSTGSAAGRMTFVFNAAYSITNVKITAWAWNGKENGKATFALTGNGSSVSFTASESTAPTLSDTEDAAAGYMTNLAVSGPAASTGFTLSGTAGHRCYISKIVFAINGPSTPLSSSSSSLTSSSSGGVSSTSSSSSHITAQNYRIAPVVSQDSSVNVYDVSYLDGLYKGRVVKTLSKNVYYTDPEDVSLFYQAWGQLPDNYVHYIKSTLSSVKREAYETYGTQARLYTEYSRSDGYVKYFPTLNKCYYIEADIDIDGTYAQGSSWNRGAGRLVIVPSGAKCYDDGPLIMKTTDHYGHFSEFYNRHEGFGALFDGQGGSGYGAWSEATTVAYAV